MDPAAAFLHRQERKAIARRRKREPILAMVPAYHDERLGIVAVTPTRMLFASRGWLRTPVIQWSRKSLAGVRLETMRYGTVRVATKAGKELRFELTNVGHKTQIMGALVPGQRPVDPIKALTRRPTQKTPRQPTVPMADPLAHRHTPEYAAKLREMVANGVMTQQELDWQLGR